MKLVKFRDIPALFLIFISFAASFLMGCGGGGGGGAGSGSGGVAPVGKAPTSLAAGNNLVITGAYTRINSVSGGSFDGTTTKSITFTSPTAANYTASWIGDTANASVSASGNVTYTVVSPDLAKVTLTNFPYPSDNDRPAFGVIEIQLTFSAPGTGGYSENGVTVVSPYLGSGNFAFSSGGGGTGASSGGGTTVLP